MNSPIAASQTRPPARKQPNILFITSDQHRADCFGFENSQVKTPHLDRLARQGTRFTRCFTPNLVCQPSRASILTGQLPLTHGAWDNGVDLDPAVGAQGMAGRLSAAGYRTGFVGKAHFSTKNTFKPTGTPESRHSAPGYGADWYGPYMGFEHVELAALGKFHRSRLPTSAAPIHRFESSLLCHENALALWQQGMGEDSGAAQTWNSALPLAWHSSTWVADRSLAFLERHSVATAATKKPFFLWASFPDPHHPFDCPAPWHSMYDPRDIVLPAHRTLDLDARPWWHRAALEGKPAIADLEMAKFRSEGFRVPPQSDAQLAHMMANYFGMISLLDDQVGRLLAALEKGGLAGDTLIVFTSDHGDMLGDHGLYLKGPMAYDGVLRVGLVMAGPGIPAATAIEAPVSTIDLAATFYDSAGIAHAESQSHSLLDVIDGRRDPAAAWSEWHVHRSRLGVDLKLRTVRTARYSCSFELNSGSGELYDMQEDPDQLVNRFDDPAYGPLREELRGLMLARPGLLRERLSEPVGMA